MESNLKSHRYCEPNFVTYCFHLPWLKLKLVWKMIDCRKPAGYRN